MLTQGVVWHRCAHQRDANCAGTKGVGRCVESCYCVRHYIMLAITAVAVI